MKITISEGLTNLKTLKTRHAELVALRDSNAVSERRYYGTGGDKSVDKTPVYSVKALDQTVVKLSIAIRKLEAAIKKANIKTTLPEYDWDDAVLGEVESA